MEFEYLRRLDRIDGKAEGLKKGFDLGHESGLRDGRLENVKSFVSLVRDGILTLPEAAKRSGFSEEEL